MFYVSLSPSWLVSWASHHGLNSISISTCRLRGVDRSTFIGHISYVPIQWVSCVLGVLDPPIRKGNGVFSLDIASFILALSLLEIGFGVVISYSILVSIRLGRLYSYCLVSWSRGVLGEGGGTREEQRGEEELK